MLHIINEMYENWSFQPKLGSDTPKIKLYCCADYILSYIYLST